MDRKKAGKHILWQMLHFRCLKIYNMTDYGCGSFNVTNASKNLILISKEPWPFKRKNFTIHQSKIDCVKAEQSS